MFERYTEKARRVIFFARYEASSFGSPYIETEHILLGILREDKALTNRFLHSHVSVEKIRKQIEAHTGIREKISTSVDLPLSNESKRVLAYAAEEADQLKDRDLGAEHLLLGLLREEKCFAAQLLGERGVKLSVVREQLKREQQQDVESRSTSATSSSIAVREDALSDFARDLTQAAVERQLDPLVGREQELDCVVEILCRRHTRNPILIGERGAGKSAIVEGLAQRIADGAAPMPLVHKRLMAVDARVLARWALNRRNSGERLNQAVKALIDVQDVILFIDDLHLLIDAVAVSAPAVANGILKHWLLRGKIGCISACTPVDYARLTQTAPWVRDCFHPVHIRPLNEEMALRVVESRKHHYETFHSVTYADEALAYAVHCAPNYLPEKPLPGKAIALLDAAGARVKLRQAVLPAEIADSMQKLRLAVQRQESAIAYHEFEKARFYSEEERSERENLCQLREKHHLDDAPSPMVTRADIEEVIVREAAYPFQP
jgi:ATP-dependent Clp protease ATP-binding subunit ClpC